MAASSTCGNTLRPAHRQLAVVMHKDKHLGRGTEDFLRFCAAAQRGRD